MSKFFKIILSSEPRLRLPRKFVKKYGQCLPYLVSLEVPKGPIFQVELTRSDGEMWLEKGFQDFKDYYSIGFGYFLVFTCNGDFHFHVAIFDTSAMEIDYPYTATKERHWKLFAKSSPIKEERQSDSDNSVEFLARIPTWQKGKRSEQNSAKPSHKQVPDEVLDGCFTEQNARRKRYAEDDDVSIEMLGGSQMCNATTRKPDILSSKMKGRIQTNRVKCGRTRKLDFLSSKMKASIQTSRVKRERTRTNPFQPYLKQEIKKECHKYTGRQLQHPILRSAHTIKAKEKVLAYQKAKAFKCRNPSFVSFMQPSYVSGSFLLVSYHTRDVASHSNSLLAEKKNIKCRMSRGIAQVSSKSIPKTFAQNYVACRKHGDVVLCVSRERTWNVKCSVGSLNAKLSWKKFVQDNGLQVGDACVFECPKDTKCSILNVIIFRTIEDAEDCQHNSAKEDAIKVLGDYPTELNGMRKRPKVEDTYALT